MKDDLPAFSIYMSKSWLDMAKQMQIYAMERGEI